MKLLFLFSLVLLLITLLSHQFAEGRNFDDEYDDDDSLEENAEDNDLFNADYDVGIDGEIMESPEVAQLVTTFHNNLPDKDLALHWVGPNGEDIVIAEIFAASSAGVNTFPGHRFYAQTIEETPVQVSPKTITIVAHVKEYYLGSSARSRQSSSSSSSASSSIPSHPATKKNNTPVMGDAEESHPAITLLNTRSQSVNVKFRSLVPSVDMWYDGGGGSVTFQGTLGLGQESTINTYEGHVFFFTVKTGSKKDEKKEIARHTMAADRVLLLIEDPSQPAPSEMLAHLAQEKKFLDSYAERNGIPWRHYFGPNGPRAPPTLYMWPAEKVGDIHHVSTSEGYWSCGGSKADCQSNEVLNLELEVVDTAPKAFIISNFISDYEADQIIEYANPKLGGSLVGNKDGGGARTSDTRTSKNAWVSRETSRVTESLFLRAADVLNIDESLLRSTTNAEDMQVVHYLNGQRYDSHHDWGVSGYAESRYITLLIYLTDQDSPDAGGETSFPKGADGRGFKVHPGKGSAVLFYNLLEDGNGDDLALHAALPVVKGEKWLANFWVWDPKRK